MKRIADKVQLLLKPKKAYVLYEDEEDTQIVFVRSESEIDKDRYEQVVRAVQFDYCASKGYVSNRDKLNNGWSFECPHCGRYTYADRAESYDEDEDEWVEAVTKPVCTRTTVFCSEECYQQIQSKRYDLQVRNLAYKYLLQQEYPGAFDFLSYQLGAGGPQKVEFRFPGCKYRRAFWYSDKPDKISIATGDTDAFNRWKESGYKGYFGELRHWWGARIRRIKVNLVRGIR